MTHPLGTELIDLRDGRPVVVSSMDPPRVRKRRVAAAGWTTLRWTPGRYVRPCEATADRIEAEAERQREAGREKRRRAKLRSYRRWLARMNGLTPRQAAEVVG